MNVFTKLRIENGYKQKELAEMLNIRPTTVSNWEKLGAMPDYPTLIKLADIYEVSTDYLLGREDDLGNVKITQKTPEISGDEREVLELFKKLDVDKRNVFIKVLRGVVNDNI